MKTFLTSLILVVVSITTLAQEKDQKIIFDVTSTDSNVHKAVMLQMKVMSSNYPNSKLEVMVYGKALSMLIKNQSTVAKEIALYSNNDHVSFTACEVSMNLLFKIDEKQLLNGVGTVENAIPDIVMKQKNGWGYIKVAN